MINDHGYDLMGIKLEVKPAFSPVAVLSSLSGGQKTLIAVALVLGLLRYRPSPFVLLDEVDANLDMDNVGILTRYISQMKSSQFLMISHREEGSDYVPFFILVRPIPMGGGVKATHMTYEQAY